MIGRLLYKISVRCVTGVLHLFCLCQTNVMFWLCLLNEPPEPFLQDLTVVTHLFGTSNFICSRTHPPLLFSGLGPLFLLFILLFSRPILLNLTRGAFLTESRLLRMSSIGMRRTSLKPRPAWLSVVTGVVVLSCW